MSDLHSQPIPKLLFNGPETGPMLVLAHGAGAGMDSLFMKEVARLLGEQGIRVVRFEFPYMHTRRITGSKRPPDRQPKLLEAYRDVIEQLDQKVVIGGKSMGGRMASLLAAKDTTDPRIAGVIALGYPFHPVGKPEKLRTDHFESLAVPKLIIQGTRDKLGDKALVNGLTVPKQIQIEWLSDGDHDLKPRVRSGYTHQQHLEQTAQLCAEFIFRCV